MPRKRRTQHRLARAHVQFATRAVNAAVLGLLARIDTDQRDEVLRGFVQMAIKLTEA